MHLVHLTFHALRFTGHVHDSCLSLRSLFMTNTLHRYGDEHSLRNDFIVFAIPCRGHNDQDSVPKLREFLRMAVKHDPVNIGDGSKGGMYRPNKSLNPLAHWSRDTKPDIEE